MKRSDAFPSKYLSQDDVDPAVIAHIQAVRIDTLRSDDGDEQKPIVHFREDLKPLILNNTNWMTLEGAYGEDSDQWIGKPVEVYRDPNVMMGKKRVGGVRFRIPAPATGRNGTAPLTDAQRWAQFIRQYDIQPEQIKAALNYEKVSEWLAATAGDETPGTLDEAMRIILAKPEPTAQIPF